MKQIYQLFFVLTILISCNSKEHKDSNFKVPEIFYTNYKNSKTQNIKFKYGDILEFELNNRKFKGIIIDIEPENNENWIGVCFISNDKLFGRKIPDGITNNCIELLDITYIKEQNINNFKNISTENLNFSKIGIGSKGTANNIEDMFRDYETGIQNRKTTETSCNEKFKMLDPINECYFTLQQIK